MGWAAQYDAAYASAKLGGVEGDEQAEMAKGCLVESEATSPASSRTPPHLQWHEPQSLDALAFTFTDDALSVQCKRFPLLAASEVSPNPPVQESTQPAFHAVVVRNSHGRAS